MQALERDVSSAVRKAEGCRLCMKRKGIIRGDIFTETAQRRVAFIGFLDGLCRICAGIKALQLIQGVPESDIPDMRDYIIDQEQRFEAAMAWLEGG